MALELVIISDNWRIPPINLIENIAIVFNIIKACMSNVISEYYFQVYLNEKDFY